MKAPHLLRVDDGPEAFAPLITAARELGLRVGWLDWTPGEGAEAVPAAPPELSAAAGVGALRAVRVGPDGAVAVKPRSGPAVLRDVLREHFLGCRLVLVRGEVETDEPLPRLVPEGDGYRVVTTEGAHRLTAAETAERLRRPRPWG